MAEEDTVRVAVEGSLDKDTDEAGIDDEAAEARMNVAMGAHMEALHPAKKWDKRETFSYRSGAARTLHFDEYGTLLSLIA